MFQWVEVRPLSISPIGSTTKSITNLERTPMCHYGDTISWTNNVITMRDYTISMSARTKSRVSFYNNCRVTHAPQSRHNLCDSPSYRYASV